MMMILSLSIPVAFSSTILFSENFSGYPSGSQAPGWTPHGHIFLEGGQYVIPCVAKGCTPANGTVWSTALYTGQTFSDFNYSVRATGLGQCGPPNLPQSPPVLTIVFRAQSSSKQPSLNTYYAWMDIDKLQISKYVNGVPTVLGGVTLAHLALQGILTPNDTVSITHNGQQQTWFNPDGSYYLRISANGPTLSMFFNGRLEVQVTDSTYTSGYIGFGTYACNGAFNDVLVSSG